MDEKSTSTKVCPSGALIAERTKLDLDRAQGLYKEALIAKAEYDTRKNAWLAADAGLAQAEQATAHNSRLILNVCFNYGGRWDILQAVNRLSQAQPDKAGHYSEADLATYLSLSDAPEPDLFIRTGGEERVSNFLLWQLAYTEFYFTSTLWPDFDAAALDVAIDSYQKRERRFGRTSEQLAGAKQPGQSA